MRLGLRKRLRETELIDAWSKIVGVFFAAYSTPVALREGILYVRVLRPAMHYAFEQISKSEILRKLKQCFDGRTIRDVRFRVGKGGITTSQRNGCKPVARKISTLPATPQNASLTWRDFVQKRKYVRAKSSEVQDNHNKRKKIKAHC